MKKTAKTPVEYDSLGSVFSIYYQLKTSCAKFLKLTVFWCTRKRYHVADITHSGNK